MNSRTRRSEHLPVLRIQSHKATWALAIGLAIGFALVVWLIFNLFMFQMEPGGARELMQHAQSVWLISTVLCGAPFILWVAHLMRRQFEAAECIGNLNRKTVADLAAMSKAQDSLWVPTKTTPNYQAHFRRLRAGPVRCDTTDIRLAESESPTDSYFLFATVEGDDVLTAYEALLLDWALQGETLSTNATDEPQRLVNYMARGMLGRTIHGSVVRLGRDGRIQARSVNHAHLYLVKRIDGHIQVGMPLGYQLSAEYQSSPLADWADQLSPGDRVIAVSASLLEVFEARHAGGFNALLEITAGLALAESEAMIWNEFLIHADTQGNKRDATLVMLEYRPAAESAGAEQLVRV